MDALLQLKGIDKSFPGVKALSGAALNVYSGRVMALVGENGAGKSTMMKVLTGIYQRDAGSLLWLGKETTFNGPKSSQEAGIGIIHQELNLIPQLTIAENIFLGREFVNRFGKIDWKTMYAEADKLLAKLNLRFKSDRLVGDLSIGDQQMVEIAKVLSFESKVIIMDEPTDALTDTETESLFRVIRELKSQGCGIVYISHRMKEIFEICDDVTVFRDGQFIAEREVATLTEDTILGLAITVTQTGIGAAVGEALLHIMLLDADRPFTSFLALTGITTALNFIMTANGVPALYTTLAQSFSDATGFPLLSVIMIQVLGYSTPLLPYQASPIVVAMGLGKVPAKAGMLLCLALAIATYLVLLPLDYLWFSVLGRL